MDRSLARGHGVRDGALLGLRHAGQNAGRHINRGPRFDRRWIWSHGGDRNGVLCRALSVGQRHVLQGIERGVGRRCDGNRLARRCPDGQRNRRVSPADRPARGKRGTDGRVVGFIPYVGDRERGLDRCARRSIERRGIIGHRHGIDRRHVKRLRYRLGDRRGRGAGGGHRERLCRARQGQRAGGLQIDADDARRAGRNRHARAAVEQREAGGDRREREIVGVGRRPGVVDHGLEGGRNLGAVIRHGEQRVRIDRQRHARRRRRNRHIRRCVCASGSDPCVDCAVI